ncbi:MAG TPA: succinate dehydrogenase cytochrome b subunit [Holophaga sp.]|nr:succinate dehydrogenase cytochrome b subunit [Holophaga sp.]
MSVAETSPGFLDTSVGKKVVMAVTGIVLFGFVTVHMLGNLQAYMGREALNHYAVFLHTMIHGMGIWVFRGVMLAAVVLHGWAALSLTLANRAARPVGYRAQQLQAATFSSRTMRWTGVFLGLFIVYHLMHLTVGACHPSFDHADPYHNFVTGFQRPLAAAIYVVAQLCLGIHMWHGVWSMTQTLGLSHPRYDKCRKRFAYAMAILVAGVNISFPVAVLAGVIHL